MKHLGITQVKLSELKPDTKVTLIQYGYHLYVYETGDARIADRMKWLRSQHSIKESSVGFLPTESQRMQAMRHLSQTQIERTDDVSLNYLTSEEMTVNLMDALIHVHNFTGGKDCC